MDRQWDGVVLEPERASKPERSLGARLLDLVWPRAGWVRTSKYFAYKLGRASGTSRYVAAGFAAGVALSFTPFLGAHLALALLLALALRGSLVAAFVGTFVGNPWTYPFIWVASYQIGAVVLPGEQSAHPEYLRTLVNFVTAITTLDGQRFAERVWPTFFPMLVGGLVMALLGGVVLFWLAKFAIEKWQAGRRARIASGKQRSSSAE